MDADQPASSRTDSSSIGINYIMVRILVAGIAGVMGGLMIFAQ